ncbi:hypothetical protein [Burkholderia catarinensis]|uniref:hypothetical protein n=1 Tax=Burkholderia catarinensis TaxID=1108140 RepID=UPI0010083AD0|nr:hypothetical protein [Burkholderia catarinensis]
MSNLKRLLSAAISVALISIHASGKNWFDSETRECDFISSSATSIPSTTMLATALIRKNTNNGGQYFEIKKSLFDKILSTPGGALFDESTLSDSDIASFKGNIQSQRTGPQASSIALSIAGDVTQLTDAVGVGPGKLMDWLKTYLDAKVTNADRLLDFITEGGKIRVELSFRPGPVGFKPYLLETRMYEVQVGTETSPRRWLLSACLLPIEIEANEIDTGPTGPTNNNMQFTRQPNGTWRPYSVDDNRYEDAYPLYYTGQDETFLYFLRQGNEEYRVPIYSGGPIDYQRSGSSTWTTLWRSSKVR